MDEFLNVNVIRIIETRQANSFASIQTTPTFILFTENCSPNGNNAIDNAKNAFGAKRTENK